MSYIDNLNLLRSKLPHLWTKFQFPDTMPADSLVKVSEAKNGMPTLLQEIAGRTLYLHSKYDPAKEAEAFIAQYKDMDQYDQVLFWGMGLGYHIKEFASQYPEKDIFIYEPSKEAFFAYLFYGDMRELPLERIKDFDVEASAADRSLYGERFVRQFFGQNLLLIILPSYERAFTEACKDFSQKVYERLHDERNTFDTNLRFQKRWVENSLYNLATTLKTPNLLLDVEHSHFQVKPAVLVAAGPSLSEEIEAIRKIKDNGLAYIIAASSSLSILINHDILPDAVCTYDPNSRNYLVIKPLVDRNITTVPVIYGTTVGHETLEIYSGPKLHMLTSQDWLGHTLLKDSKTLDFVHDAPTITIVALQFLYKLGCNPIILVGQNLALKNGRSYPKGIDYYDGIADIKDTGLMVEDVEGNQIETTEGYKLMLHSLEQWIKYRPENVKIINTTRGGAKIVGTEFEYLDKVIERQLHERIVSKSWFLQESHGYDNERVRKKLTAMEKELENFPMNLEEMDQVLTAMELALKSKGRAAALLYPLFPKFDKAFNGLMKNNAHTIFFQPMNRAAFNLLMKRIKAAETEGDQIKKVLLMIDEAREYVNDCEKDWKTVMALWKEKISEIHAALV